MNVKRIGCICGLSLLVACMLAGCHEPNQSAQVAKSSHEDKEKTSMAGVQASDIYHSLAAYQPESNVAVLNTCNLESLNGVFFQGKKISVSVTKPVRFSGWISANDTSSLRYALRFEDRATSHYFQAVITPDVDRPDVASRLGTQASHAGFSLDLDLKGLPPAEYHVYLAALEGSALYACDNGRVVVVSH